MQGADILALAGLRIDGRRETELRRLKSKINVEQSADGSAYLEQGLNKVLVLIHGPHEPQKRGNDQNESGTVVCRIINAPFSGTDRRSRKIGDRRTLEMETVLNDTLQSVILLNVYPRSQIDIVIHILESDGSILCSVFNALTLALMNAGIAMSDMISSCSVGYVKQMLCIDMNQMEQSASTVYIPIAVKCRTQEILYFQLDSRLSQDKLSLVLQAGVDACSEIGGFLENEIKTYIAELSEKRQM